MRIILLTNRFSINKINKIIDETKIIISIKKFDKINLINNLDKYKISIYYQSSMDLKVVDNIRLLMN